MESLELRTLLSVLPPPTVITQSNLSNEPVADAANTSTPTVAVDPLDPLRAVATWTTVDTTLQSPKDQVFAEAAYTTNGGVTWTKFAPAGTAAPAVALPLPIDDPEFGPPLPPTVPDTQRYAQVTDTSVAFDRDHDFYVLSSEHNALYTSGSLVLQKYNFSNLTPNLTLTNKIVHEWLATDVNTLGDEAFTPTLAVDSNVGNAVTSEPSGTPSGIVTGPDNNTYVVVTSQNSVQQLTGTTGQYQGNFASGSGLYTPTDLTFDPTTGDLFVTSSQTGQVIEFDGQTGAAIGSFTSGLVSPKAPADMVLVPDGASLLVSNSGTNSILRYNALTGAFQGSFVASGSGGLNDPQGLAFNPANGNLYVASQDADGNGSVLEYNGTTGAFITTFVPQSLNGGLLMPRGMTFGPNGNLYVSSFGTNQIIEYDRITSPDGATTGAVAFVNSAGAGAPNDLSGPTSLAFSPVDGDLYVDSYNSNEVLRYNAADGTYISSFLAKAVGGPVGLAFHIGSDNSYHLYVGGYDPVNQISAVYDFNGTTGAFDGIFVSNGDGNLDGPASLVFGSDGTLFISSQQNNQILRFYGPNDAAGQAGTFQNSITPAPLTAPKDSVLSPDGKTLYAVSSGTDSVVRYDATTGELLGTFVASGAGGLNQPTALAFDTDLLNTNGAPTLLVATSFDDRTVSYNGGTLPLTSGVLMYDGTTGAFLGTYNAATKTYSGGEFIGENSNTPILPQGKPPVPTSVLGDIEGLAYHNGSLYVTSTVTNEITTTTNGVTTTVPSQTASVLQYTYNTTLKTGLYTSQVTPEPLNNPDAAVIGPDKNLYVSSSNGNEILQYDGATGAFISIFVSPGGALSGGLVDPTGMYFQISANPLTTPSYLYVSSNGTNQVLRYTVSTSASTSAHSGLLSTVTAESLYTPEPENTPEGMAYDAAGNLYVASSGSNEILEYGSTGNFKKVFVTAGEGGLSDPQGIAFDSAGNLYVASQATNQVLMYNASGAFLGVFASDATSGGLGDLNAPEFLKFDSSGNLYVSTFGSSEVLRYTSSGAEDPGLDSVTGQPNPGAEFVTSKEGLVGAYGLAFDSTGNLYVASNQNDEVVEFNTSGQNIGPVLFSSNTPNAPTGIAIDTGETPNILYVASGNGATGSTVQEFSLKTTLGPPTVVTGTFLQTAVYGDQLGLDTPTGILFTRNGTTTSLLVASSVTNQVLSYSGTDVFDAKTNAYDYTTFYTDAPFTAPTLLDPQGLSIQNGTLYVSSGEGVDANNSIDGAVSPYNAYGRFSSTPRTRATPASAIGSAPTPLREPVTPIPSR